MADAVQVKVDFYDALFAERTRLTGLLDSETDDVNCYSEIIVITNLMVQEQKQIESWIEEGLEAAGEPNLSESRVEAMHELITMTTQKLDDLQNEFDALAKSRDGLKASLDEASQSVAEERASRRFAETKEAIISPISARIDHLHEHGSPRAEAES